MNSASSSTTKFGATLKTVAANMAIMLAIKAASKSWNTLNVTVEGQTSKINELTASYEGLKSEYDELSQKQDIIDAKNVS